MICVNLHLGQKRGKFLNPRSGSACERASTGVSGGRIAALFRLRRHRVSGKPRSFGAAAHRGRSLPSRLGQARRRAAGSERSPLPALPSQLFGEHGLHSRRLRRFHSTRRNMRAGTRERASQDARGLSPLLRRCPMRGPRRSLGAALA